MKALKWILSIILILIAVILIWALMLPAKVDISAEVEVDQPYQMVFHSAASFKDRVKWDPWLEQEPSAKSKFEFVEGYVGSTYQWSGKMLGAGKMQVDSVKYGKYIASSLFFGETETPSLIQWFFTANNKSTKVTWNFNAKAGFPFERIMYKLFVSSMMKESLNKGLANFKKHLESKPTQISRLTDIKEKKVPAQLAMTIKKETNMAEIEGLMRSVYTELYQVVGKQQLKIVGIPFSRYTNFNQETGDMTVEVGLPVEKLGRKSGNVRPTKMPAVNLFSAVHHGPYSELPISYGKLMEEASDQRLQLKGTAWDFSMTNPTKVKEVAFLKTIIGYEIKE